MPERGLHGEEARGRSELARKGRGVRARERERVRGGGGGAGTQARGRRQPAECKGLAFWEEASWAASPPSALHPEARPVRGEGSAAHPGT